MLSRKNEKMPPLLHKVASTKSLKSRTPSKKRGSVDMAVNVSCNNLITAQNISKRLKVDEEE